MKAHELKILPKFYEDIFEGKRSFELRKDDRDFQVGDYIIFREYDGEKIHRSDYVLPNKIYS